MLELHNIEKRFKDFKLEDINLTFEKGNIYFIVGKNGSGKTTIFKIILNLLKYDSGNIYYEDGRTQFLNNTSIMADYPQFQEDYSGLINLDLIVGKYSSTKLRKLCEYYGLNHKILKKNVRTYSLGQRRLLAIIVIILQDKDVLILDEPSIGLDYYTWLKFEKYLKEVSSQKLIIISGHNYVDIYELCNKLIYLDNGTIKYSGPKEIFIKPYENINLKLKDIFKIE